MSVLNERTGLPEILQVPGWERHPWLRAGFSTRFAGASGVYGEGELNLGWTKEDEPGRVALNRAAYSEAVGGGTAWPLVTVGQVHSTVVRDLEAEAGPLMTADGRAALEGDGLISLSPGRLLAILTADCVPVLVADQRTHAVGAFHAGWRGTLGRIVEHGIERMRECYGTRPEDVIAAIGPCIGSCCFEVGQEVQQAFAAEFPYGPDLFVSSAEGKFRMDLVEANRRQLKAAGVRAGNMEAMGECTACARTHDGRRRFYSYRAEAGRCGRMLSAIGAIG